MVLCFITVLIFYCQRAFEANDKDSSNTSLAPSSTGRRSQQLQPYWVDGSVYRNRAQKHYDDYHLAAPVAQLSDSGVIRQVPEPSQMAHCRTVVAYFTCFCHRRIFNMSSVAVFSNGVKRIQFRSD
ncbi:unnamed protein product [Haemonchus placei]|uniref:Secreted protein n=1 Tax=Haemonchus placei TaxID=6290 RepID=A0A3P7X5I9_HAEPC|nr:unnamed protein product [Haemonchus placei]